MAILLLHKFMSIVTILEFGARIGIQHHQVKSRAGDLKPVYRRSQCYFWDLRPGMQQAELAERGLSCGISLKAQICIKARFPQGNSDNTQDSKFKTHFLFSVNKS